MKKYIAAVLMFLLLFAGCGEKAEEPAPAPTTVTETIIAPTEAPAPITAPSAAPAADPSATDHSVFDEVLRRYHTALSEQWNEGRYFEQEMSPLGSYYYEGDALANVGYAFLDLDFNGKDELLIGAILNGEESPILFELWTEKDGKAVQLVSGHPRNRWSLIRLEEEDAYMLANEGSNGAASSAWYYYNLVDGELNLNQAIVFDAAASPDAPWFTTLDTDWDVSNDTPETEELCQAIIDAHTRTYKTPDYTPFSDLA